MESVVFKNKVEEIYKTISGIAYKVLITNKKIKISFLCNSE